jgi:ceramide glucosyltransferase
VDQPLHIFGAGLLLLAVLGSAYLLLAGWMVRAFRPAAISPDAAQPAATLLKPLHGDEPGLEAALETLFAQDYAGPIQVIFGVQDPADPARAVAERLRERHPRHDVTVVIDARQHGANRKVSNLINMAAQARHEVLVLADSDIAVRPDYLRRVTAALDGPKVGVVTCPYYGVGRAGFWSRLAAMGLSYQFLPSVALGVAIGMATPCMGSTIALRREALRRIGGFEAFADLLADDYEIGAAVRAAGLKSVVAPVLVAHGCAESSLGALFAHELRWAATVRRIDPAGFFGSAITHALVFALIGALLSPGLGGISVLALTFAARLWVMRRVEKVAGLTSGEWWLIPVRDILSFAVFVGAFFTRVVEWRGSRFRVDEQGGMSSL